MPEKNDCKFCDGRYHILSKGGESTLWMKGNVVGLSVGHEENMSVIDFCPYCSRNIKDMGGLEKNAPLFDNIKYEKQIRIWREPK